jgi:hypothetical protein
MTLITDLDTWVAGLATATGLPATRDPDLVNPPCLFVSLPDTVGRTLPSVQLEVPVYLVAAGAGKQAGDQLLSYLVGVLEAVPAKSASAETLTVSGVEFHAYRIPAQLIIT